MDEIGLFALALGVLLVAPGVLGVGVGTDDVTTESATELETNNGKLSCGDPDAYSNNPSDTIDSDGEAWQFLAFTDFDDCSTSDDDLYTYYKVTDYYQYDDGDGNDEISCSDTYEEVSLSDDPLVDDSTEFYMDTGCTTAECEYDATVDHRYWLEREGDTHDYADETTDLYANSQC